MASRRRSTSRDLPFRQIAQFWNWLPAFRAVAEAGGVNEAARLLAVSPSALSRSVGLLESALGQTLFYREGGLALTADGERLLAGTREAMRLVHESTRAEAAFTGPIHLAATSRLGFYRLLPALRAIRDRWPGLRPHTSAVRDEDVAPLLLRGRIDLAIVIGHAPPKRLAGARLRAASCHVYCGEGHPLHAERSPAEARVRAHAFAAPSQTSTGGVATDAWPVERPREIGLVCDTLEPAIDACVRGELLTCFPDEVVTALGLDAKLRPLPSPELPPVALLCVHRPPVTSRRTVVDEIVSVLAEG